MRASDRTSRWLTLLVLARTFSIVRRPVYRVVAASIAIAYAVLAMLIGGMLEIPIPPAHLTPFWTILTQGSPWWNFPALVVETPGLILVLPFLSTIVMILVSTGVGIGMTAAVYLSVQLIRRRRAARSAGATAAGSVAGLSPAMIGLVTLGACCSTTAAATAGLAWTAVASGTTIDALLLNNWYAGVFQLGVLYIALIAQEELIGVYGALDPTAAAGLEQPNAPFNRRTYASLALRVALLVGGVTWLLALPAEWTGAVPPSPTGPMLFQWVGQHIVPALFAIGAALFPVDFGELLRHAGGSRRRWAGRAALALLGGSLVIGLPGPLASQGAYGFLNELLGLLGAPASWGAVAPPFVGGALAFRWALQFLLLGGWMIAVAAYPTRSIEWVAASSGRREAPSSRPASVRWTAETRPGLGRGYSVRTDPSGPEEIARPDARVGD